MAVTRHKYLNHTYLKTILFICAFTSCRVENESKENSRRGVEPNWNAPTLTCRKRQWPRGPRLESHYKHSKEEKGVRKVNNPAFWLSNKYQCQSFCPSACKRIPKTTWTELVKFACVLYWQPPINLLHPHPPKAVHPTNFLSWAVSSFRVHSPTDIHQTLYVQSHTSSHMIQGAWLTPTVLPRD